MKAWDRAGLRAPLYVGARMGRDGYGCWEKLNISIRSPMAGLFEGT